MHGRRPDFAVRTAAVFLCAAAAAQSSDPDPAGGVSPGVLITMLAFPVITAGMSLAAVLLGRRAGRAPSMLRAILGALIGLVLTAALGLALLARDSRDVTFFATSIFTLGAIPTGLIGLIVGGLASLRHRHPRKR